MWTIYSLSGNYDLMNCYLKGLWPIQQFHVQFAEMNGNDTVTHCCQPSWALSPSQNAILQRSVQNDIFTTAGLSQYHVSCAHFRLSICDWNLMSPIYSKPPQHNQHQSQRCELHEQLILWDSDIPQSQDGWNHLTLSTKTLRCCVEVEGSITSKSIKFEVVQVL